MRSTVRSPQPGPARTQCPTSGQAAEMSARAACSQDARSGRAAILAADDQPHILEAIELLLRPQGYRGGHRAVARRWCARRWPPRFYDAVLIDLNYTRDTTSGQEGLDLLSEIVALDSNSAGHRHDRVGQCGTWRSKPCAAVRATSSRSRGRTSACWPFCAPRSNCIARCSEPSDWRPRTACCGAEGRPEFIAAAAVDAAGARDRSHGSVRPTPTC